MFGRIICHKYVNLDSDFPRSLNIILTSRPVGVPVCAVFGVAVTND